MCALALQTNGHRPGELLLDLETNLDQLIDILPHHTTQKRRSCESALRGKAVEDKATLQNRGLH